MCLEVYGSCSHILRLHSIQVKGTNDFWETDKLGKLALTIEGCKERDQFVLQTCFNLKIPVMCSMGGGYSKDINIIVNAHANTFRLAQEIYF